MAKSLGRFLEEQRRGRKSYGRKARERFFHRQKAGRKRGRHMKKQGTKRMRGKRWRRAESRASPTRKSSNFSWDIRGSLAIVPLTVDRRNGYLEQKTTVMTKGGSRIVLLSRQDRRWREENQPAWLDLSRLIRTNNLGREITSSFERSARRETSAINRCFRNSHGL